MQAHTSLKIVKLLIKLFNYRSLYLNFIVPLVLMNILLKYLIHMRVLFMCFFAAQPCNFMAHPLRTTVLDVLVFFALHDDNLKDLDYTINTMAIINISVKVKEA